MKFINLCSMKRTMLLQLWWENNICPISLSFSFCCSTRWLFIRNARCFRATTCTVQKMQAVLWIWHLLYRCKEQWAALFHSEQEITQMLTRVVEIPITGYEASNLQQAIACTSAWSPTCQDMQTAQSLLCSVMLLDSFLINLACYRYHRRSYLSRKYS